MWRADCGAACAAAINFSTPTRIQQSVIPVLLAGRDVLASAPTGSGKTLAYIAPIVHQIQVPLDTLGWLHSGACPCSGTH